MKTKQLIAAVSSVLLAPCLAGSVYGATITSTFDTSREGWRVTGNTTTTPYPSHVNIPYFGHDPGFLSATDDTSCRSCQDWYYVAPATYHGDLSMFLNGTLSFELMTYPGTPWNYGGSFNYYNTASDVILEGDGMTLVNNTVFDAITPFSWTSFSLLLSDAGGWLKNGSAASQNDIAAVLADMTSLRIRGDLHRGVETTKLDNVRLEMPPVSEVPVPAAAWLFGSGFAGLMSLRRRKAQAA